MSKSAKKLHWLYTSSDGAKHVCSSSLLGKHESGTNSQLGEALIIQYEAGFR
eukprot:m.145617 g.145617  ORF g.145617 m.145617 type:complete len:52 (-) comp30448_c0_seq1:281-436(-)